MKKVYNQPQTETCSMQMGYGIMVDFSVKEDGPGISSMPRRGQVID
jgi:hypothetical protein